MAPTQKAVSEILVSTKTDPSFQIWSFPSSHDDTIIFKKIKDTGAYKSGKKTVFIKTIFLDGKCGWAVNIGANIGFHSLHMATRGEANEFDKDSEAGLVMYVHAIETAAAASPGVPAQQMKSKYQLNVKQAAILLVLLHNIRQQANLSIILISNFLIKIERKDITSRALKYRLSVIHQDLVQHLGTCCYL